MKFIQAILFLFFSCLVSISFGQKIVYSEPDREDSRRLNFEIIGKVSDNFLVYKNNRVKSFISVYDNDMVQKNKEELDYIPDDRLINADFIAYQDFFYMIYEYQKKNVVYCNAVKMDGNGKKISDILTLDTSHIGFAGNNKIYSTISSEDKSKIMVYKINARNRSRFVITSLLFDKNLALQKRTQFAMPMQEHEDYLDEFTIDNDGDLVFAKFTRNNNETINSSDLFWKKAYSDSLTDISIPQKNILLDEIHIKADNVNKRYFLTSFYYKEKRGNIEGFYFYVWDKQTQYPVLQNSVVLGEELRQEAKGESNVRMAFNDYFIRNIIIKKDGGFLINTESYYTTSRGNSWNRWNYLYGSPYGYYNHAYDYYYMLGNPYYNSWYHNHFNDYYSGNTRYHADNVTVLSFDKNGKLQWSNVIHKEQFDDESGDKISYEMVNTGGQLHYIFNMDEKRTLLLNDFTLTPDGQISHNPTLKNLDKGYEFMPKYGKQVSSYQAIIPCYYRNYICFAKVEYN